MNAFEKNLDIFDHVTAHSRIFYSNSRNWRWKSVWINWLLKLFVRVSVTLENKIQRYYLWKNLQRRKEIYIFLDFTPSPFLLRSSTFLDRVEIISGVYKKKKKEKSNISSFLRLPRPKRIKATPRCVVSLSLLHGRPFLAKFRSLFRGKNATREAETLLFFFLKICFFFP